MTNFTRLTALSMLTLTMAVSVNATAVNPYKDFDLHRFAYKGSSMQQKKSLGVNGVDVITRGEAGEGTLEAAESAYAIPDFSFSSSEIVGDLDGPDGKLWFYTGSYKYDYVPVADGDYKRPIMREYEFTVYDSDLKKVGAIKDKVRYKEGEVAVPLAELAPVVTRNFFNSDDKYEIVVGLYVNTEIFINNEYSIIYSIGGEKEDGYDKPIMERKEVIGDVLNASTDNEERFYITFLKDDNAEVSEKDPDNPDPNDPDKIGYWEMLTSYGMRVATYSKADTSGNLVKLWENRIRLADLPGDQMSAPFLMSFVKNGKPYFLYSQYEDTFFNPYYDFIQETTMRENNNLILNLFTPEDGKFVLLQETKIPTHLNKENDRVLCSYYSVGSFRYRDDVIIRDTDCKAEFMVTVQDYSKENDDSYDTSFFTYNPDGSIKNTLYKNAFSRSTLADLEGFDPMEAFISLNVVGDFVFHFVNLRTGEEELSFTNNFEVGDDIDPELITSNLDRVPFGDTFKYAVELRSPGQDEDGNDLMRVMWITRDGKFERIDEIPMGTGVYYATVMVESSNLNPKLYDDDDEYEYLVLVKRGYPGNTVKEELLVAKPISDAYPEGKTLLYVKPEEERGVLKNIAPYPFSDSPLLIITYHNEETNRYYEDFYKLPLNNGNSGVDMLPVVGDNDSGIMFDGHIVSAPGNIAVFGFNGARVAEGLGSVRVDRLPKGMYVVSANGSSAKILVK